MRVDSKGKESFLLNSATGGLHHADPQLYSSTPNQKIEILNQPITELSADQLEEYALMNLTNERTGRLPVERFLNLLFPNPQYREVMDNINYFTKMDPVVALLEHDYAQRGNIMSQITNFPPPLSF